MARKVERIVGTFHGFPAEIEYSPGVCEMTMWLNFDGQSLGSDGQPFEHGHHTFTGVSVEQWDAIKSHLTQRAADKSQRARLKVKLRVALAANANRCAVSFLRGNSMGEKIFVEIEVIRTHPHAHDLVQVQTPFGLHWVYVEDLIRAQAAAQHRVEPTAPVASDTEIVGEVSRRLERSGGSR